MKNVNQRFNSFGIFTVWVNSSFRFESSGFIIGVRTLYFLLQDHMLDIHISKNERKYPCFSYVLGAVEKKRSAQRNKLMFIKLGFQSFYRIQF